MHALILWVLSNSEKTCTLLPFNVACNDSVFVYDEPTSHSATVIGSIEKKREKTQSTVCFSLGIHLFIQPITEIVRRSFHFMLVSNWCMLSIQDGIKQTFKNIYVNILFFYGLFLLFFLVCCLLVGRSGCQGGLIKVCNHRVCVFAAGEQCNRTGDDKQKSGQSLHKRYELNSFIKSE